jgi:hypothetical protein
MTKAIPTAKAVVADVAAEAPSVKIEEGTVNAAAINVIPEAKVVSTDTFGNKIEEL